MENPPVALADAVDGGVPASTTVPLPVGVTGGTAGVPGNGAAFDERGAAGAGTGGFAAVAVRSKSMTTRYGLYRE